MATPSGIDWVAKFPTSKSLDDLVPAFKDNCARFIEALKTAGATVTVSATKRPAERAYLMHFAWCIVFQDFDPQHVLPHASVDIEWWHGDLASSKKAAEAMVEGFGIQHLKVPPSLTSRHIEGKAIDMSIAWTNDLSIATAAGIPVTIKSAPRDGTNAELIQLGATYGVLHLTNVTADPPHWSTDGR